MLRLEAFFLVQLSDESALGETHHASVNTLFGTVQTAEVQEMTPLRTA
jgi:hypothetical protein